MLDCPAVAEKMMPPASGIRMRVKTDWQTDP